MNSQSNDLYDLACVVLLIFAAFAMGAGLMVSLAVRWVVMLPIRAWRAWRRPLIFPKRNRIRSVSIAWSQYDGARLIVDRPTIINGILFTAGDFRWSEERQRWDRCA